MESLKIPHLVFYNNNGIFRKKEKKMIKIALIDNGIHEEFKKYVDAEYKINKEKKIVSINAHEASLNPHGGICASIIKTYYSQGEVISIQTLDEMGNAEPQMLGLAFEWCMQNDIDIISLSAGSVSVLDIPDLKETAKKLEQNEIIVVAAANNCNSLTYPASFDECIGVKCDLTATLKPEEIYVDLGDLRQIEVTVGSLKDIPAFNKYDLGYNNSFVAPYVAARIAGLMEEHGKCGKNDYIMQLKNEARENVPQEFFQDSFPIMYNPDPIFIQVTGKDCTDDKFLDIVLRFRKEGYCAIGITDYYAEFPCFFKTEGQKNGDEVDFIIKSTNPDLVFFTATINNPQIQMDSIVCLDNEHESSKLDNESENYREKPEDPRQNTCFLGSFGNYGVSVTGGPGPVDFDNVYVAGGDITDDKKKEIFENILQLSGVKKKDISEECFVDSKTIYIKDSDIPNGELVNLVERVFS